MSKYYLTTPIYYVNDLPHIGHAYTTIAADVLARWKRLHNEQTFFLTGTDEHGQKISQAAEAHHISPKQYCDKMVQHFLEAWQKLDIAYDHFIRTTDEEHIQTVKYIFRVLKEKNLIYKKKYRGLYCVSCEKFLSPDDLVNGLCPDHQQAPILQEEENYFFRLSAFQQKLTQIISAADSGDSQLLIEPAARRKEILGKLSLGLQDLSISRANLSWGVPLPFDEQQTAYVWMDALINYISALGYRSQPAEKFLQFWPADLHLMAKDILWFHAVIWPALLLALELPLPKKIFAHGFFTINGQKMSKTLGNVISPQELLEKFGPDATRYLLLAMFPFGSDGDINFPALTERYNTDLANNLGNLFTRTLTMIEKYFNHQLPETALDEILIDAVEEHLKAVSNFLDNTNPSGALTGLQEVINLANSYIQQNSPWTLAKTNPEKLARVLASLLAVLSRLGIYFYPFLPRMATRMLAALGYHQNISEIAPEYLNKKYQKIARPPKTGSPEIFFPRLLKK